MYEGRKNDILRERIFFGNVLVLSSNHLLYRYTSKVESETITATTTLITLTSFWKEYIFCECFGLDDKARKYLYVNKTISGHFQKIFKLFLVKTIFHYKCNEYMRSHVEIVKKHTLVWKNCQSWKISYMNYVRSNWNWKENIFGK